ncbi:MAG: TonB-dependent receptor [Acidobacteriaceae bacterium]|nr:TonB-dependent receptor [Acidobacteriaceae bacterium]MBV9781685.1 TonB-dependent receptor [Acidobacteriaceae bacterium]
MRPIFSILATLAVAAGAYGQTFRGAIDGTVTDATGAVVQGAQVTATNTATSVSQTTVSTTSGEFSFQDMPLGTYTVTVTASGFEQTTVSNVVVTAGNVYTVPIKLQVGQMTTKVEVSAAAIEVDTTSATQSDTIPSKALQDLPLNGRDFSQLIAVAPGYGGYAVSGFGSLNGTRANQMNWQIDGTDNNDFWHNIPAVNQGGVSGIAGVVMPIDAIDEFSAQTQSNAEAGRNAGGTVNLVIKSGTNQLHGSAYYYNRNEFYAAQSPFFVPTPQFPKAPELRNYNTGLTVGGPIIRDKTFFFLGFEKQQYIFGLTGLSTEPSAAWVSQALSLLSNPGGKYGPYAPVTPSPLSATLLSSLWPSSIVSLPGTINNYFATVPGTGYSYNGVAKIDHNFNDKEHLSVHWFAGQGSQSQPPGASLALATASSNLGYYFEVAPIHVQNYSVVLNSLLSSKLNNQLLAGVSYFNQVFHDANNSFNMAALGLNLSPDATIAGKPILGASNIAITGFDQVGITPPEGRNDVTGHLTDIVSYTTGKHEFRFGGEFRQGRVNEFYFRRSTGAFTFDGTQGPWATPYCAPNSSNSVIAATCGLADFLAGDVSTSSIAVGDAERFVIVNGYDLFVQDAWRLTPKLTLNFGLRNDYFGPISSNGPKDLGVFVPGRGLVIQGNGIGSIFPPDHHNFAPRFGFAYQPWGGFVVRGGIGVFFDQININPFLDYRPPISAADGLEDNPVGQHPVDNYARNGYNWQTAQAGGASIFPGVTTCSGNFATDPGCLSSTQIFNVFSVNQNFRTPYFYNYNVNVEKSLGNSAVWQIGYVGSDGHKLSVMENINQNGTFTAQYPNFGSIIQLNSVGTSNYNSLQTTLKIRSWRGFNAQFAYTWAHALDEMTEYRGAMPLDSFNLQQEYGSSDFDTRHNFTAFLSWDVPGSSHFRLLTSGWQVTSAWSFHSGQPFCLGLANSWCSVSGTQRPGLNLIGDPFASVNHNFVAGVGEQWVSPAAFCVSGTTGCPGSPNGDVSRNLFAGPGFADVDLSVFKNIPIRERLRIQLRAEMFNIFNRKNLATGAGSVGSNGVVGDTIGDFNGAPGLGPGEPFNMQLAAKIIF